jgi:hypothetical protein
MLWQYGRTGQVPLRLVRPPGLDITRAISHQVHASPTFASTSKLLELSQGDREITGPS